MKTLTNFCFILIIIVCCKEIFPDHILAPSHQFKKNKYWLQRIKESFLLKLKQFKRKKNRLKYTAKVNLNKQDENFTNMITFLNEVEPHPFLKDNRDLLLQLIPGEQRRRDKKLVRDLARAGDWKTHQVKSTEHLISDLQMILQYMQSSNLFGDYKPEIVLFGSYADGRQEEVSDVDFTFVESPGNNFQRDKYEVCREIIIGAIDALGYIEGFFPEILSRERIFASRVKENIQGNPMNMAYNNQIYFITHNNYQKINLDEADRKYEEFSIACKNGDPELVEKTEVSLRPFMASLHYNEGHHTSEELILSAS